MNTDKRKPKWNGLALPIMTSISITLNLHKENLHVKIIYKCKRRTNCFARLKLAEGKGFEPLNALTFPVFKTGAIDHSANLPYENIKFLGTKSSENDFVEKFVELYVLAFLL